MVLLLLSLACAPAGSGSEDGTGDGDAHSAEDCPEVEETDCPEDSGYTPAEQPDTDHLAGLAPVVVRTVPQAGDQAVDPGLTEIRVTFSRDMTDESWSWVQVDPAWFPEAIDARYDDARTAVLEVQLEPDHSYVLQMNSDGYQGFRDTEGTPAMPYQLAFHTTAL